MYPSWGLGDQRMRETYDDVDTVYGHGAEPETSAMMGMDPEVVVESCRQSGTPQPFAGWTAFGYANVAVPGQPAPGTVELDRDELTSNGVTRNGSVATPEWSQVWIERVASFAVAVINHDDQVVRDTAWATRPPTRRLAGVNA